MNGIIWNKGMKEFEYRTRPLRKCNILGMQPNEFVALWNDNCSSHSSESDKEKYKKKKIDIRQLIPLATHIQQPVDQHVGVAIKNIMKKKYFDYKECILDEVDDGKRDEDDKINTKTMRYKFCEFAYEAVKIVKEKDNLLRKSWMNFGIELPMDGSLDGDISTLHVDGRYKIDNDSFE